MQVFEFQHLLETHPNAALQFILPSGVAVPAHFHVTEVGRIEKSFVDCGGAPRASTTCLLQLWTADDTAHRLLSSKLSKIMTMASVVLKSSELEMEVEFGTDVAATYTIDHGTSVFGTVQFFLAGKKTDCLAKDKCGVGQVGAVSGCC